MFNKDISGFAITDENLANKFIENFNLGKVVAAIGGIAVGAGMATVAMELLPDVDVDKMLKRIVSGVDKRVVSMKDMLKRNN